MGWLFSAVLGPLFNAIGNVLTAWFGSQRDQALGAAQQQVKTDDATIHDIAEARAASDAADRAAVADPASLRQPDPDSRD